MKFILFPTNRIQSSFGVYSLLQIPGIFFICILTPENSVNDKQKLMNSKVHTRKIFPTDTSAEYSHLFHLHLLKFKFRALHFVCGLCALINKMYVWRSRTKILSLSRIQELFFVISLQRHQLSLQYL